ncbi:hypothetical protein ACIPVB_08870 [Microbacterium sp. NPDC090007]|uniref:hypothetical protein n=1 Tax=Microbacterium sp. NPDC090007 TaxID=3364204 RepID=UPI003819A699
MPKLGKVPVYAGVRVGRALDEVTEDMDLYHGVRLSQVMEAVYEQGRRDGRSEVFDAFTESSEEIAKRKELAHRKPGKPRSSGKK